MRYRIRLSESLETSIQQEVKKGGTAFIRPLLTDVGRGLFYGFIRILFWQIQGQGFCDCYKKMKKMERKNG